MKVLIAHNFYGLDNPSGENSVVLREIESLRENGVMPLTYFRFSDELRRRGMIAKMAAGLALDPNPSRIAMYRKILKALSPSVLHVHNLWPLITYDLLIAAKENGIRTIQTLHNHRLICTNTKWSSSTGMRGSRNPEERQRLPLMLADHRSALANMAYNKALSILWAKGIPNEVVDSYLCLTAFQRSLFVSCGLRESALRIKPNFVRDPGVGGGGGGYVLFAGRLTSQKGVDLLVKAWSSLDIPLHIAGSGPLSEQCRNNPRIHCLGPLDNQQMIAQMKGASMLVVCSRGYEAFPLVIVEAMSVGTPCLVPDLGGMPEIIGDAGSTFQVGDAEDLRRKVLDLWQRAGGLRKRARRRYLDNFSESRSIEILRDAYGFA